MRFSESDVLAIWDAMRCPSESSNAKVGRTSSAWRGPATERAADRPTRAAVVLQPVNA